VSQRSSLEDESRRAVAAYLADIEQLADPTPLPDELCIRKQTMERWLMRPADRVGKRWWQP
jgi:hypothetical protein